MSHMQYTAVLNTSLSDARKLPYWHLAIYMAKLRPRFRVLLLNQLAKGGKWEKKKTVVGS
ncbi:hypothetical protein HMPREF1487_09647 [Pseudomonas sp. HPB0071]|nr:hypothetical protein HMPREF1487_09647 [Pseudomonas sp. HPB0071]